MYIYIYMYMCAHTYTHTHVREFRSKSPATNASFELAEKVQVQKCKEMWW